MTEQTPRRSAGSSLLCTAVVPPGLEEAAAAELAELGAAAIRPLRRAVMRLLEDSLAEEFLSGRIGDGDAAVVDVNDLGRVKVLASSPGCDEALLERALRPNPAGNANERTPLVLVRP